MTALQDEFQQEPATDNTENRWRTVNQRILQMGQYKQAAVTVSHMAKRIFRTFQELHLFHFGKCNYGKQQMRGLVEYGPRESDIIGKNESEPCIKSCEEFYLQLKQQMQQQTDNHWQQKKDYRYNTAHDCPVLGRLRKAKPLHNLIDRRYAGKQHLDS